MKIKKPKIAFDIYKWLPPYGENAVQVEIKGRDLLLRVLYDAEGGKDEDDDLIIRFEEVCFFQFSSMPGVDMRNMDYEVSENAGAMIEYEESEAAERWDKHFGYSKYFKHYQLLLLSDNSRLEIFSKGFSSQPS